MRVTLFAAAMTVVALPFGAAGATPFSVRDKGQYGQFEFSWSSEASAVPALVARLRTELAREKARTIDGGKRDYSMRRMGWQSVTSYTTRGETPRLLSLAREYWAFTGGAHGNGATTALLWDRRLGKEIPFASLFSNGNGFEAIIRGPYCRALDRQRAEKRGGSAALGTVPEFDSCPALKDVAIIPGSAGRQGRFTEIHLIAAAYTAGPYVEGEYDTVVPVSRPLIAALKPQYRPSFAAR